MLKAMLSEKLKLDVGPLLTIFSYLFKQLEMGLVCHFKMPSEKIKVRRGTPFENFLYVFKQLKRGLVSHSKILEKTMLSES